MNDYDVRRCRREDYGEFLDVMNEAFGHCAEFEWFQRNVGNCTPYPEQASDDLIDKHVIAVDRASGEIMGGVGVYPFDLIVSEDAPGGERFVLPIIGVGQVCCARKFRNRGVMSATLTRALEDAAADGAVAGFLGGDTYRYGHFGFEYGGGELRLDFRLSRLRTVTDILKLKTRAAGVPDIGELNGMYETLPSYIKRGAGYWKMLLGRKKFIWRVGELDGKKAYIAYGENYARVLEICGDPDAAAALLAWHMETRSLDRATAMLPLAPGLGDPLAASLRKASSYAQAAPANMDLAAVFSVDKIYETLKPAIERMRAAPRNNAEKAELVRYLISAPGHPVPDFLNGRACGGDDATASTGCRARPLVVWMSEADSV